MGTLQRVRIFAQALRYETGSRLGPGDERLEARQGEGKTRYPIGPKVPGWILELPSQQIPSSKLPATRFPPAPSKSLKRRNP